jgi:DNA-binding MarR family transcriptional regulator/GNAT superfamily N-acetyltransferase
MESVPQVRSFNRTVTQQIGALEGQYLGRGRSLGACRLLFEIGAEGLELRTLRTRLGLDSGYLSRLLRGLEREGLVRTGSAPGDARVRFVRPTPRGRRELDVLNRLSDRVAAQLLAPLSQSQRLQLTSAMQTVERLLHAGAVRFEVVSVRSPVARECLRRYFAELAGRFAEGFDPRLSHTADEKEFVPPAGYFVVATLNGTPVGCGALKHLEHCGEIKRMWVRETSRGLGLGRRILQRLEDLARELGLTRVRLETNRSLKEAQALYRSSGYRQVKPFNDEPYAHFWFEKDLTRRKRGS